MLAVKRYWASLFVLAALFLASCASDVPRDPVAFVPAAGVAERSIVFMRDARVTPSAGYSKILKGGSAWKYVGSVPQGKVYAPTNDVFMLSGRNFHEAYCVVADGPVVVGFYLPVEQAFVALPSAVSISIKYQ